MTRPRTNFFEYLINQGVISESEAPNKEKWPEKYNEKIDREKIQNMIEEDHCTLPGGRNECRYIHKDECFCRNLRNCKWVR